MNAICILIRCFRYERRYECQLSLYRGGFLHAESCFFGGYEIKETTRIIVPTDHGRVWEFLFILYNRVEGAFRHWGGPCDAQYYWLSVLCMCSLLVFYVLCRRHWQYCLPLLTIDRHNRKHPHSSTWNTILPNTIVNPPLIFFLLWNLSINILTINFFYFFFVLFILDICLHFCFCPGVEINFGCQG